jgi:hypothetical protein
MSQARVSARCTLIVAIAVLAGLSACERGQPARTTEPESPGRVRQAPAVSLARAVDDATGVIVEPDNSPSGPAPLEPVFRPDDLRPRHDDARLKGLGIQVFESKRLKLYTDVEADAGQPLPGLIDQAYEAWEAYFGPLPPNRAGTDFQITGYLIRDMARFRELGLIPEEFTFEHGCNLRNEFWMRDQEYDYYRRHLLIHEATHSFMTFMPGVAAPVWYMEGMAEYFGAHRLNLPAGPPTFGVMPTSPAGFAGFGRITIIREDFAANRAQPIPSILAVTPAEFRTPDRYAWAWALCAFLDGTPRYHERFQTLGRHTQGTQFPGMFADAFDRDQRDLATEWTLYVVNLQYGYDIARAAIDFHPGVFLTDEQPEVARQVASDRGWQSSRVQLEQGDTYEIAATGRFTLADHPKPWESEPHGIAFRYFDGCPLGTLLGCLRSEEGPAGGVDDPMLSVIALGRGRTFQAPVTGTLYLRLNDAWNSLHDNRGHVDVTIRRVEKP